MQDYNKLTREEKIDFIKEYHLKQNISLTELAKSSNTYVNKIRRDAKKFQIKTRNKSEAQKIALETGKRAHPMKGKTHSEESKNRIGDNKRKTWHDMPQEEKDRVSTERKKQYKKLKVKPHEHPEKITKLKEAAKFGSKLEVFLFQELQKDYYAQHQKEHTLKNDKFHIDILLEDELLAIEIDGPAHSKDIWGEEKLKKVKTRDARKDALVIESGYTMIRVPNDAKFSKAYAREVLAVLKETIEKHKNSKKKKVIKCKLSK